MDEDDLPDAEALIFQIGNRDTADDVTVLSELDATDSDDTVAFPYITFDLTSTGESENGPGAYVYQLDYSVFAVGRDAAWALARTFRRIVYGWYAEPGSGWAEGAGVVEYVGPDISVPSKVVEVALEGRQLVQYSGSLPLIIRSL